jgi:hypothetical protein
MMGILELQWKWQADVHQTAFFTGQLPGLVLTQPFAFLDASSLCDRVLTSSPLSEQWAWEGESERL